MWRIIIVAATLLLAAPAYATVTWTNCNGTPRASGPTAVTSSVCVLAAFTASDDDLGFECTAESCLVAINGGSVSVQLCVGATTDGSNCEEEASLSSSDPADRFSKATWWLDLTGSGTVEIRGQ